VVKVVLLLLDCSGWQKWWHSRHKSLQVHETAQAAPECLSHLLVANLCGSDAAQAHTGLQLRRQARRSKLTLGCSFPVTPARGGDGALGKGPSSLGLWGTGIAGGRCLLG
jgi:hypothetical protein